MNWARTRKHRNESTEQRRARGKASKTEGRLFENQLQTNASRLSWQCVRLPEGGRFLSNTKFIKVKSPFDFILSKAGCTVAVDTKSTKSSTFSYSELNTNQVTQLHNLWTGGTQSGYIVNFRTSNQVVFFNAQTLKRTLPGTSLKPEDGLLLGTSDDFNLDFLLN
jgi:penicillin-binding protein-related factor A (putative recombinase)